MFYLRISAILGRRSRLLSMGIAEREGAGEIAFSAFSFLFLPASIKPVKRNFVAAVSVVTFSRRGPAGRRYSTTLLDDRLSLTRVRQPRAISRSLARTSNGVRPVVVSRSRIGVELIIVNGKTRDVVVRSMAIDEFRGGLAAARFIAGSATASARIGFTTPRISVHLFLAPYRERSSITFSTHDGYTRKRRTPRLIISSLGDYRALLLSFASSRARSTHIARVFVQEIEFVTLCRRRSAARLYLAST